MESAEDIHTACRLGDISLLRSALSKNPSKINEKDLKLGWTSLYRSVICGHYETTELLLKSGADPNIKTKMGDTALHQAADNRQYKLAELLILNKADLNTQQNDGESPLHLASFKGDTDMVKLLLFHKADPNLQNLTFGKTALHYAVDYSYTEIVSLLVSYNANPDLRDKHGKSAKDIARSHEVLSLLSRSNIFLSDPFEVQDKNSLGAVSPILSIRNSEYSMYSDSKSVEIQVKQLEDIHKKIREKVKCGTERKDQRTSNNTSCVIEPESERSALVTDKSRVISFGGTERNNELKNFLITHKLEEALSNLLFAGYDDLTQLANQIDSIMPVTEKTLKEIGILKQGLRKRLLLALDKLKNKENLTTQPKVLNCCSVSVKNNFMFNMPSLETWLDQLNLTQLKENFLQAAYDDLNDLVDLMNTPWEITSDDLRDIGIDKPGHRHRILSKLKEDSFSHGVKKREILIEKNESQTACESCNIY